MIRRIFKTGNSFVVSLPREVLEALGLGDGQSVNMEFDREQRRVIISPLKKPFAAAGVDADFARQLDRFLKHYRPALEELAK